MILFFDNKALNFRTSDYEHKGYPNSNLDKKSTMKIKEKDKEIIYHCFL